MLSKEQTEAYHSFYDAAHHNEVLEPKTTLLVHMAAAMALGCYPWMEHYLGVAKKEGITQFLLGAVQAVVMAVSAGKVRAQFREVRIRS